MDNPNPTPNPDPNVQPPAYPDWREQRRAEREAHRQQHGHFRSSWPAGVVLVLLGVIFLLENMGFRFFENWWALFLLIPAFWSFASVWDHFQEQGRLTRGSVFSLVVGAVLTLLCAAFLLNLNQLLYQFWPVLLIIVGLAMLGTGFLRE